MSDIDTRGNGAGASLSAPITSDRSKMKPMASASASIDGACSASGPMVDGLPLGRLERIEVRDAWDNEALDFTPWLATDENLALLGETIGIELECESQERRVGPFRADILCKDTATHDWVLIENQLERTDHNHLGQLLTYAAGLKAVTIVWVAERFTEEHRAALDWLNEITDERFNFFGLEIELWRIGKSQAAPKFNIVSKPNDWSRSIQDVVTGELTDTQRLYLEYWTAFKEHVESHKSPIRMGKPQPQHWMTFPLGRTNFYLSAAVSQQKKQMVVQLVIYGGDHVGYFKSLETQKVEIEQALTGGPTIEWRELPEGRESHVRRLFPNTDPANRADRPRQHALMRTELEQFHSVLAGRVRDLELSTAEVAVD